MSRDLTREVLGYVDLFLGMFSGVQDGCHSTFPEVTAVFVSLR